MCIYFRSKVDVIILGAPMFVFQRTPDRALEAKNESSRMSAISGMPRKTRINRLLFFTMLGIFWKDQ